MIIKWNSLCQGGHDMNIDYSEKKVIIERTKDKLNKIIYRRDVYYDTEIYEELFDLSLILEGKSDEYIKKFKQILKNNVLE